MKLKLYQKPAAMIGPTLIGLYALVVLATNDGSTVTTVLGLFTFLSVVAFWIVAFTVDPTKGKGQAR